MANICDICLKQYTYDSFNSIIYGSADFAFRQIITYGCLCQLLKWAKAKKQSYNTAVGNTDDFPTDLSGMVYTVINKIHTFGASSSNASSIQLKSTLPAYCTMNRSVTRALTTGNVNCCLTAQCLYESSSPTLHIQTATERKRASRMNVFLRHSEQTDNTKRRKLRRKDSDYRQQEQTSNTIKRKSHRQDFEFRQQEQSSDSSRRKSRRLDSEYRQHELTTQREHNCGNTVQLVSRFRQLIQSGPIYVCTSCDQLFYKHSVQTANSIRSLALSGIDTVLLGKTSSDGHEYICHTCAKYVRQNKMFHCK